MITIWAKMDEYGSEKMLYFCKIYAIIVIQNHDLITYRKNYLLIIHIKKNYYETV